MKQLTSTSDFILASDICRALETAGIESKITDAIQNYYTMNTLYTVWVPDAADLVTVQKIANEVPGLTAERPTRVSVSEGVSHCDKCNYDLRGQRQDGNCPECGKPYYIVLTTPCPTCGTAIPTDFDVCWNCGKEMTPAES